MIEYKVLLSLEVSNKLRSLKRKDQECIVSYLNFIKHSPFDEGDSSSNDELKPLFIKGVNKHLISYFADHANKEIRITDIRHINEA